MKTRTKGIHMSLLRARVLVCALLTVLAMTAARASAATLTVNTTVDETTPGDRACSLREAIVAVNSLGSASGDCAPAAFGANTIVLQVGRYTLGSQFPPQHDELLVAPTVTSLTISGASEGKTTIDASNLANRVLEIPAGANVAIKDLTISGGRAPAGPAGATGINTNGGDGQAGGNGGSILNNGTLTMTDAAVTNSRAGAGGVGGDTGTPGFPAVGNPAPHGGAGAAGGSGGAIFSTGTLTLTGVTIATNDAGPGGIGGRSGQASSTNPGGPGGAAGPGGSGGGVANVGGTLTIADSTIRGNGSGAGGAGGTGGGGAPSGTSIGGVGATGGAGGSGGGVWSVNSPFTVRNSTIVSNASGDGGSGGTGGSGAGSASAGGAGGQGGDAGSGGAVAVGSAAGSTIVNATIAGNTVGRGGQGGTGGSGATQGANGSAGNGGSAGGVIGQGGSVLVVQNSLFALNTAGNCGSSVNDGGHNLSFGGVGCPAGFLGGDPNLGPLQDNGGPSQTIALGAGSAAIDKIPPAGAGCPATDQRGVRRPSGPACDIGAYELAPPKATPGVAGPIGITSATLNGTVVPNAGDATVQFIYGTTTKYGSKSSIQHVSGVTAAPVVAKLARLKAKVTYHYRIVVTSSDGIGTSVDRTFKTSPAPVISAFTIKPSGFRAGGKPATITYSDTLPASVTFVVLTRRGKRNVTVGRFRRTDKVGANTVSFTGRVGGRKLKRGSYQVQATPRANRLNGKKVTLTFRITG